MLVFVCRGGAESARLAGIALRGDCGVGAQQRRQRSGAADVAAGGVPLPTGTGTGDGATAGGDHARPLRGRCRRRPCPRATVPRLCTRSFQADYEQQSWVCSPSS